MLLNKTTSIAYIDPAPYVAVFIPGAAFCCPPDKCYSASSKITITLCNVFGVESWLAPALLVSGKGAL